MEQGGDFTGGAPPPQEESLGVARRCCVTILLSHPSLRASKLQQLTVQVEKRAVWLPLTQRPVDAGGEKRGFRVRVGGLTLPCKRRELRLASPPHRIDEVRVLVTDKVAKGSRLPILLPHEQKWNLGSEQQQGGAHFLRLEVEHRRQTITVNAVAHLIVVLGAHDKTPRLQIGGAVPMLAPPVLRVLAGVGEAFIDGAHQMVKLAEVVVVAAAFGCEQCMYGVMEVVAPLGIQRVATRVTRTDDARIVQVALGDELDSSPRTLRVRLHMLLQLRQNVMGTEVEDPVDGVDTQDVDVHLTQPVESALNEEGAHLVGVGVVEVDGTPPWSVVAVREIGAETIEVVPFRTEVVVDDVERDRHFPRMARIDQTPKPGDAAVGSMSRERIDAVVAPVAISRKLGHRHELDGGDTKLPQGVEPRDDGIERAFGREGPDVKFVEDQLASTQSRPCVVAPGKRGLDHRGRAVHTLRLMT
jgi:hypothetical protein